MTSSNRIIDAGMLSGPLRSSVMSNSVLRSGSKGWLGGYSEVQSSHVNLPIRNDAPAFHA
jgi:hypothetical protein